MAGIEKKIMFRSPGFEKEHHFVSYVHKEHNPKEY